jgi:hypothetical protein
LAVFSGIYLTLLIGRTVPLPANQTLIGALERVEVTHSDEGRSGFQITFKAGRGQPFNPLDYPLLLRPELQAFSRVILVVTLNAIPKVLLDGVITDQQFAPGSDPDQTILTVTGEDVSVMMDLEENIVEHPGQNETMIANKIIAGYAQYGLAPKVIPPPVIDLPLPIERVPVQHGTDLKYLLDMAARYAYVFYITPGPAPGVNQAYWGPPPRLGLLQNALSLNMGPDTNIESINFRYDALAPQMTSGQVQDRKLNQSLPVFAFVSTRLPLAMQPGLNFQSKVRQAWLGDVAGLTVADALARAQANTNASTDNVLVAEGELDAARYGHILEARRTVGVRGVGYRHDGLYYVKRVSHVIEIGAAANVGSYRQQFTLTREGAGTVTPVVRP